MEQAGELVQALEDEQQGGKYQRFYQRGVPVATAALFFVAGSSALSVLFEEDSAVASINCLPMLVFGLEAVEFGVIRWIVLVPDALAQALGKGNRVLHVVGMAVTPAKCILQYAIVLIVIVRFVFKTVQFLGNSGISEKQVNPLSENSELVSSSMYASSAKKNQGAKASQQEEGNTKTRQKSKPTRLTNKKITIGELRERVKARSQQ